MFLSRFPQLFVQTRLHGVCRHSSTCVLQDTVIVSSSWRVTSTVSFASSMAATASGQGPHTPGAASGVQKPAESLKNMNAQTAKHAQWMVRILSPKLIRYSFMSKGRQIDAEKFQCLLVSSDAKQFMIGSVPFNFSTPKAATTAAEKFQSGTCFSIRVPEFDNKVKIDYMSTPIKRALLLTKPTEIKAIPLTSTDVLKDISNHVDLDLTLTQVLDRLRKVSWSGSGRTSQLLNVTGKIKSMSDNKQITIGGRARHVSNLELVDREGSIVEISVWDTAVEQVVHCEIGDGITIVGCSAQRDRDQQIKLSLWDSGHVLIGGPVAQALSSWDPQNISCTKLTAVFTPSGPLLPASSIAVPTCAAALANLPSMRDECVIQINRCIIDAPTTEDQIFTQDGQRLYTTCRLRDWSGTVEVDMVSEALLKLYNLSSTEEVKQALENRTLQVNLARFNARGVLRPTETGMKVLIGLVEQSPLSVPPTAKAMRDVLGLAEVTGDIVLATPATRVQDLSGLVVEKSDKVCLTAHRVLLLVQGTSPSVLDPVGQEGTPLEAQSFRVTSTKTRCLLSESEEFVNLYGYCDYKSMLQHRLDKDTALVLASAVEVDPTTNMKTFTVESIDKVQDVEALKASLDIEWRTVLLKEEHRDVELYSSPLKPEYWGRDVKRLKRIISEP